MNHLCRAGLAAAGVTGAAKRCRRSAFDVDPDQRILDDGNIGCLGDHFTDRFTRRGSRCARHDVNHLLDQVRFHLDAIVGQRRRGRGQLQHGEVVVALADAQRDGFAGVPLLLIGALVGAALPVGRGQQAAHLAKDVDAGKLTKAKALHLFVDGVHAQIVGQYVVVGVAGLHDRLVHVDGTVPALFVVPKAVVAEHEKAGVRDGLFRSARSGLQGRQRHERLVGGSGWIGAAQGTVQERLVG